MCVGVDALFIYYDECYIVNSKVQFVAVTILYCSQFLTFLVNDLDGSCFAINYI